MFYVADGTAAKLEDSRRIVEGGWWNEMRELKVKDTALAGDGGGEVVGVFKEVSSVRFSPD